MKRTALFSILALFFFAISSFAAGSICDATPGNLVLNCGFETGDFTSWTDTGNTGYTSVSTSSTYVNSGTYGAQLGPVGSDGILSQTLSDSPGNYTFSFWLDSPGGTPNDFTAYWDGTPVSSQTNSGSFPFTQYSFSVVGTGNDTISFGFRQDPSYWGLDDVAVVSSPEPRSMALLGTGLLGIILAAVSLKRRDLLA